MTANDCFPVGARRTNAPKPEVFIALPTYSQACVEFVGSLQNLAPKIPCYIQWHAGDSLVTRARNNVVHEFLKTEIPWLLFIDTDLVFQPEHIEHLLSHSTRFPIVGGCYPKKKTGPAEWVLNALPGKQPDANGLQEVAEMGTGMLKVHRSVFGALREAYPQLRYLCDAYKDIRYDFFPVGTFRDETFPKERENRYLSEDWYICQLARMIGYSVWADTKCTARHLGTVAFPWPPEAQQGAKSIETGKLTGSAADLAKRLETAPQTQKEDGDAMTPIVFKTRGWSGLPHYQFFRALLVAHPLNMLVVGVYQGRDLCFLLDIARRFHPEHPLKLTGVDAFSDGPCADWPEEKRGMTWEQAGFGPPPSMSAAIENCRAFATHDHFKALTIVEASDEKFFAETKEKFDVIYLDTSHDEATVKRQLSQVARICSSPETIICGDDYTGNPAWGVEKAVKEAFNAHGVFANMIWFARAADLK